MKACREVMECYEMTGTSDYIVKVMVANMDAYHDLLHNVLLNAHLGATDFRKGSLSM